MYCNRLQAWWSTQSRLVTLHSSLIVHPLVGLQTLWRFWLKDLSIDDMVGAWCFGCCQAHQGLPVGFLLLRYSVLFTVESLSLPYLLYISWFICSRRWCIDKLGVFHANQTSMCLDPHLNLGRVWRHKTGLSPPVNISLTVPKRCFFCGSFLPVMLHVGVCCAVVSVPCSLVVTCWERVDLLAVVCCFFLCFVTFPNVS